MPQASSRTINHPAHRSFNGCATVVRIFLFSDQPGFLRLWREKRRKTKPEDHFRKLRPIQPGDGAGAKPSASPVRAAHIEFVTVLAEHPPRTIPLDADNVDLEDRAQHLGEVLSTLAVYLTVILDDTAQNVPGGLDLPHVEAVVSDVASDLAGAIQRAAEGMTGRVA